MLTQVDFESKEPRTLNAPWIALTHEDTLDAQNCLDYITNKFDIDPDQYVSEEDRGVSRAFNAMLEHHLYWYFNSANSLILVYEGGCNWIK